MVFDADTTASNAEAVDFNEVGHCLQWCRERAGIDALYLTAAQAGLHADRLHVGDRDVPRGAFAFWTGGSDGAGHIVIGLGNGQLRSTDAGGPGRVATVPGVEWFDQHWTSLSYLGWADNVNGITVPGVGDDMPLNDADKAWLAALADANKGPSAQDIAKAVWQFTVNKSGTTAKAVVEGLFRYLTKQGIKF